MELGLGEVRGCSSCCQFRWLPPQSDSLSPPRLPFKIALAAPGLQRFPDISAKLVRMCEITGNRRRCKNFFENSCPEGHRRVHQAREQR